MSKAKGKVLTTVIKGSVWARGGREDGNSLRNADDTFCCLGLDAAQRGCPIEKLLDIGVPSELLDRKLVKGESRKLIAGWKRKTLAELEDLGRSLEDLGRSLEGVAVDINDDVYTTDDEKIAKLRKVFAAVKPPRKIIWLPDK